MNHKGINNEDFHHGEDVYGFESDLDSFFFANLKIKYLPLELHAKMQCQEITQLRSY